MSKIYSFRRLHNLCVRVSWELNLQSMRDMKRFLSMSQFGTILNLIMMISVVLYTFNSKAIQSEGGTSAGGGGGGGVHLGPNLVLIDFFNTANIIHFLRNKYASESPSMINTAIYNQSFLGTNDDETNSSIQLTKKILNDWSSLPYDAAAFYIEAALKSSKLKWSFSDDIVPEAKHYRPKYLNSDIPIVTAAYYSTASHNYTVQISRPLWNKFFVDSQVGLIVHETLRHLQIGRGFEFNDESLQKATVLIMACKPRVQLSQYILFLIGNKTETAEKNIGPFEKVISECMNETL